MMKHAPTRARNPHLHWVIVDPDYDDQYRLRSWDVRPCTCDRPWSHPFGTR